MYTKSLPNCISLQHSKYKGKESLLGAKVYFYGENKRRSSLNFSSPSTALWRPQGVQRHGIDIKNVYIPWESRIWALFQRLSPWLTTSSRVGILFPAATWRWGTFCASVKVETYSISGFSYYYHCHRKHETFFRVVLYVHVKTLSPKYHKIGSVKFVYFMKNSRALPHIHSCVRAQAAPSHNSTELPLL